MTLRKKIFIPLIASFVFMLSISTFAADPPPVGGDPTGGTGNEIGGSAPVGSGLALIIGLGLAYGTKRTYQLSKEEK